MLDKLIESKNNSGESRRLGRFLFSTFTAAVSVLTVAFVYSLFTYNLAFGSGNLDQSALAAPVRIEEQTPPAEKPAPAQKQASIAAAANKLPTRRENILRVDEMPKEIPTSVSVVQNQSAARPNSAFTLSGIDSDVPSSGSAIGERGGGSGSREIGDGIAKSLVAQSEEIEKTEVPMPPPLKIEPKKPELPKRVTSISGGVVNGKAINLVPPIYSPSAKALRVSGEVKIQVTIDEDGNVISASAVSGHPLLRQSAVSAARNSKFSPTLLSNQRVKVTGIIIYNFKQQ